MPTERSGLDTGIEAAAMKHTFGPSGQRVWGCDSDMNIYLYSNVLKMFQPGNRGKSSGICVPVQLGQ